MQVFCNLYSEWIAGIRHEMAQAGFGHSALSDQDCAIRWHAWKRRIVPPAKRNVLKAGGFNCPSHSQQALTDFEQVVTTGADLWPWQSKLIDRPSFEDGLYNDFRVVHFHLGAGFEPSGYINRTGELLFAIIDSASVYEIGIYNHGDWYELDILDIIEDNWPRLLDRITIQALDVSYCPKTRDEVKALREAKLVSIMRLKSGRIIAPLGGGMTTDGTSIEAVRFADYWARILLNGEKAIAADITERVQSGDLEAKDYEIHLHASDDEISGVYGNAHKWILWKRI